MSPTLSSSGEISNQNILDGLAITPEEEAPALHPLVFISKWKPFLDGEARRASRKHPRAEYDDVRQIAHIAAYRAATRTQTSTRSHQFRAARLHVRHRLQNYISRLYRKLPLSLHSIDAPFTNGQTLGDYLPAPQANTPTDQHPHLAEGLQTLPARDRQILRAIYHDGLTMAEIARRLQLTRARVWQIHQSSLQKLRRYLTEQTLRTPPAPHQCLSVSIRG